MVELSRRSYTTPFVVDTLNDLGIPCHHYRDFPTDLTRHACWFICLGVFADNYILSTTESQALVNALGQGGERLHGDERRLVLRSGAPDL